MLKCAVKLISFKPHTHDPVYNTFNHRYNTALAKKQKKITFLKQDWCLVPAFGSDKELFDKMKNGGLFKAPFRLARNAKFSAKYRVLLDLVYESLPEGFVLKSTDGQVIPIRKPEDIHWHIKMQLGLYEMRVTLGGRVTYEVGSVSFGSMDEYQFQEFYNGAVDIILRYFLVGTDKDDLEKEVLANFASYR